MSVDLRTAAADWLADRRCRGYRLADHDWLVASFLDGLAARGVTTVTVAEAMAFARGRLETGRRWQAARLRVVRGLAAHVHALDPAAAELIPAGLIPARINRRTPYLYCAADVARLMSAAAALSPPMLAASMATLIGLLASTGMRGGEAFALDLDDLDADAGVLTVTGKHGKRRLVPLHPTTVAALADYQQVRSGVAGPSGPVLVGTKGGRLNPNTARAAFRAVADSCGLASRPGCAAPTLHGLRHTFAVDTLVDAHRQGADVDARVATLATYLGHVEPANTYWYLSASPELMAIASERVSAAAWRRRP